MRYHDYKADLISLKVFGEYLDLAISGSMPCRHSICRKKKSQVWNIRQLSLSRKFPYGRTDPTVTKQT